MGSVDGSGKRVELVVLGEDVRFEKEKRQLRVIDYVKGLYINLHDNIYKKRLNHHSTSLKFTAGMTL